MSIVHIHIPSLQNYFAKQPVELVYLLGSYAKGTVKPYSDIDFGVLFTSSLAKAEKFKTKISCISDLSSLLHTDAIDVIDLTAVSPMFQFEAIKERKEIYIRSEDTRVSFEKKVLSSYFDYQYYLKRHVRLGINHLKREYGIAR